MKIEVLKENVSVTVVKETRFKFLLVLLTVSVWVSGSGLTCVNKLWLR